MTTFQAGNLDIVVTPNGELTVRRITTRQKGSWRWQDAFGVSYYALRYSQRQKRHFWTCIMQGHKLSAPAMRRLGITYRHGSLHNLPVSGADMMALATVAEMTGATIATA